MKNIQSKILILHLAMLSAFASNGNTRYGFKDGQWFFRSGGGDLKGLYAVVLSSKLYAVALIGTDIIQFVPRSRLLSTTGTNDPYTTGFALDGKFANLFEEDAPSTYTVDSNKKITQIGGNAVTVATHIPSEYLPVEIPTFLTWKLPTTSGFLTIGPNQTPNSTTLANYSPVAADGTVPTTSITLNDAPKDPATGTNLWTKLPSWARTLIVATVIGLVLYLILKYVKF